MTNLTKPFHITAYIARDDEQLLWGNNNRVNNFEANSKFIDHVKRVNNWNAGKLFDEIPLSRESTKPQETVKGNEGDHNPKSRTLLGIKDCKNMVKTTHQHHW